MTIIAASRSCAFCARSLPAALTFCLGERSKAAIGARPELIRASVRGSFARLASAAGSLPGIAAIPVTIMQRQSRALFADPRIPIEYMLKFIWAFD